MCISWFIGPKSWRTGFSSQRTLFLTLSTCSELSPSTLLTNHCEGTDSRIGTTPPPAQATPLLPQPTSHTCWLWSSLHLCQMKRWCWRHVWVVLPCGHTVHPSPSHPSYTKSWNSEKYQRLESTPDHFSKTLQDKSQPSTFCKSSPSDSDVQSGSRTIPLSMQITGRH